MHTIRYIAPTYSDGNTSYDGRPMPDQSWGRAMTAAHQSGLLQVQATWKSPDTHSGYINGVLIEGFQSGREVTYKALQAAWDKSLQTGPTKFHPQGGELKHICVNHDKGQTTFDGRTMIVFEDGLPVFECGPRGVTKDRNALADSYHQN